jgi:hypothetical protein
VRCDSFHGQHQQRSAGFSVSGSFTLDLVPSRSSAGRSATKPYPIPAMRPRDAHHEVQDLPCLLEGVPATIVPQWSTQTPRLLTITLFSTSDPRNGNERHFSRIGAFQIDQSIRMKLVKKPNIMIVQAQMKFHADLPSASLRYTRSFRIFYLKRNKQDEENLI